MERAPWSQMLFIPQSPKTAGKIGLTAAVIAGAGLGGLYLAGGTGNLNPGILLVPSVIVGFYFGALAGMLASCLLGILAGPFMPLTPGVPQETSDWLLRIVFYALVAGVVGVLSSRLIRINRSLDIRTRELHALNMLFQRFLAERADGVLRESSNALAQFSAHQASGINVLEPIDRSKIEVILQNVDRVLTESHELLENARNALRPR